MAKIQFNGTDSYVKGVKTSNNDTLFIDYGLYSDSFNEVVQVRSLDKKRVYDSVNFKYPKNMIFSENAEIEEAQGIYLNEYFYYDMIDGKKAKLGFPKIIGKSRCLLYIPNIDSAGNKLGISIKNVDSLIQRQVYEAFKSITLKKPR